MPCRYPHRNLDDREFSLPAIDNVISRGRWRDWADLRRAAREDPALLDDIARICAHYVGDPYAQRYHFWMNHVEAHRAAS